jgi:transcriptional regulator with XRE-family HTH domain
MSARVSSAATKWPVWAVIREARHRAGLTQAELAKRIGTSQPAIARYERARSMPDLPTLHRIVEACGLELRLELAEPDPQRAAAARLALERTVEERLEANERQIALVRALRDG